MMRTGWLWHEAYRWHDTGTPAGEQVGRFLQPYHHFDSAPTKDRFASLVGICGLEQKLTRLMPRAATEEDLVRIHTPAYVESIQMQSKQLRGGDAGDGATFFGNGGYDIACLAAGGAITAVEAVVKGAVDNAYALIRPAGHHARPETGMGFCIFANSAIATAYAREKLGVGRVAIIDGWDVHHGNGTEACFEQDPDVLTISIHQDGNFPTDSGRLADRGQGAGFGSVINIPLPPGSGDGAYDYAFSEVVIPAIEHFRPELIIVASGFDSSNYDPLGRMLLTSRAYASMTHQLRAVADAVCDGRLVMLHEGGYSAIYVPFCGVAVVEALSDLSSEVTDPFLEEIKDIPGQTLQPHQQAVIDQARAFLADVPA